MKTNNNNKIKQKIIIPIIILLLFNFIMPNFSQASVGGVLISPVTGLLAALGDAANRLIFMTLGTRGEESQIAALVGAGEFEVYITDDDKKEEYILAHPAIGDIDIQLDKEGQIMRRLWYTKYTNNTS